MMTNHHSMSVLISHPRGPRTALDCHDVLCDDVMAVDARQSG
jgi:hypothetical protein